jgi:4-alpha-glucanotransferase
MRAAFAGFQRSADAAEQATFADFRHIHGHWLNDFALYAALREEQQHRGWFDWPQPLRDRAPEALDAARHRLAAAIDQVCFDQFVFFRQWHALRDYANERGVRLFGDVPIFVAYDSADVWARRDCFRLDAEGRMEVRRRRAARLFLGDRPALGQSALPLGAYRGGRFPLVDRTHAHPARTVRPDPHRPLPRFRGALGDSRAQPRPPSTASGCRRRASACSVPCRTASTTCTLVAEDLGIITPEVDALRTRFGLPGMKILQFAFGASADNPYLPHNHEWLSVVYTGTHDNDTTLGWYGGIDDHTRAHIHEYLGHPAEAMPWTLIRSAFASVAVLAVVPMQDVLALGSEHRMNTPGVTEGNWGWRFDATQIDPGLAQRLRLMIESYGRLVP